MSDSMMSVEEALAWLDPSTGPKPAVPSPLLVDRYAHTVVEQDETIQTLSRLLAEAEEAAIERAEQIERVRDALDDITREKADSEHTADALLAGADAPEAIGRVRRALNRIKADPEHARDHDDDAEWYAATADALEYVIDLLTGALEGDIDE